MWDKSRIALFHTVSWTARILLLLMLAVMPWWYGGAQWQAQWWLVVAGIALTCLTWLSTCLSPRRVGACVPLTFVMVAFLFWAMLQLVPLPQFAAAWVSGAQQFVQEVKISADVQSDQPWLQSDQYRTVTIAAHQTRASLAVLAVAVVAVWSSTVLFLQKRWVIVLAITLVASGLANGMLGLYQLVNYSQWTLLELPSSKTTFATFVSRNSAPAYYASVTAATMTLMGVAYTAQKRARRKQYRVAYPGASILGRIRNRLEDAFIDLNSTAVTCLLILAFMLIVTLATFSRGGILACLTGCAITLCLTLGGRGAGFVGAAALSGVMLLVVGGVISFLQLDETIYSRFDSINATLRSGSDPRWVVWRYTATALLTYGLFGCGLGTFRFALQPFHQNGPSVWFHHPENMPLEIWMETGLPGLVLAGWAVYLVGRQILVHSQLHKEQLLLSGVVFASCAIGIQSLVDFAIILPGVFMPYCVLLGAFLGRTRRIEKERERLGEMGVAEYDHRTISKLPPAAPTPGKFAAHCLVAGVSLLGMLLGLFSLAGYSMSESLHYGLRNQAVPAEGQGEDVLESRNALRALAEKAAERFGEHPEVALLIGQVEQFLWRVDATEGIEWGQALPLGRRWELANPQVLSSLLRLKDEKLADLQARIRAHSYGIELSRASESRMQYALAACPQDARAAWGMLIADCNWLSPSEHHALLELLSRVIGNNTQVMVEVAIIAIREGQIEKGTKIFRQVLRLDWQRMTRENLAAILPSLDEQALISMLPDDAIKQAHVVDLLERLSNDPTDPWPQAAQLADQLARHASAFMSEAQAVSPDDCRLLAKLARRNQDLQLEVKILQRLKLIQSSDLFSRFRLVAVLGELERHNAVPSVAEKLNPSGEELLSILKSERDQNKLLAHTAQEPLAQVELLEQIESVAQWCAENNRELFQEARSFKELVAGRLVAHLRTTRGQSEAECQLLVELARATGDQMALARQEQDLMAIREINRKLASARSLHEQGKIGEAVRLVREILKQNPPNSVRLECEDRIKKWTNR